jgi:predicted helicase
MIEFFNEQVTSFERISVGKTKAELFSLAESFIDNDSRKISWSHEIKEDLSRSRHGVFKKASIRLSLYRPYTQQAVYFDSQFNNRQYQLPRIFPSYGLDNIVICVTGIGATKEFSTLVTNILPDLEMISKNQCFPLYLYEKEEQTNTNAGEDKKLREIDLIAKEPEGELIDGYRRRDAITDAILSDFRKAYEKRITKEDIFYYVYGVLHSPEYRTRFAADLKKMLPRLPFTRETADFWRFSKAGRDLAHWHLNYETVEPWPVQEHNTALSMDPAKDFLVQKMTFGRKAKEIDKTTIHYNDHITLTGIPLEAYDYVVNGKPAIEWIMERYQITVDKDSGIRNDPNDWSREHNQPRYILDLVKRIVRVSLETMKIVNALPPLNEVDSFTTM